MHFGTGFSSYSWNDDECGYNNEDKVLQCENVEHPLELSGKRTTMNRIVITEDYDLPANSETILWAKMDGDCRSIGTRLVEQNSVKENIVARSIVRVIG